MFIPQTQRIEKIARCLPHIPAHVGAITGAKSTSVYIDYANVRWWSESLRWHVDLKRLHQFFQSFSGAKTLRLYYGTLDANIESAQLLADATRIGYKVRTKRVKRIRVPIDARSVPLESPEILRKLISASVFKTLTTDLIRTLNTHLRDLNKGGVFHFEDLKCNFDVEIGTDMLVDDMIHGVDNYFLWSCDSDFADTVMQLLERSRKVVVFGPSGKIARELSELRNSGLEIYEVRQLKQFVCWPRELDKSFK